MNRVLLFLSGCTMAAVNALILCFAFDMTVPMVMLSEVLGGLAAVCLVKCLETFP